MRSPNEQFKILLRSSIASNHCGNGKFRIVPGSAIVIRELRMAFLSELVDHRRGKLFTRDKYTPFVNAVKKTSSNIGLDCFCTN